MKKLLFSIAAVAVFALASCASHQTTTTTTYGQGPEVATEWHKCAVCNGKGSCTSCKGTGKISGSTCATCKGTGKCQTCNGNGGYATN